MRISMSIAMLIQSFYLVYPFSAAKLKKNLNNRCYLGLFFVSLQQILEDMALNLNKNLKLYYTIGEVAQMFGLNESTLRYWEQEFPSLRPKVSGPAKIRQYQEKDIEEIRVIHNLVKVRGFKLAAAKKMLNQNRKGVDKKADVLEALIGVRSELQALKKQLDFLQ